jgi:DNA-directed RNA polymerase subunit H (RpoH/RPB5)
VRPAGHQGREAARLEQPRQPPRQQLADPVAGEAAVTEGERRIRRDDVRRVAGDAAETLAENGLEQASLAQLHVRDPVEREVEAREGQGAGVYVGRDDVTGVAGEQERLDPVAGAEVEGALDRLSDRQVGERGGRPVDARDAVNVLDVEPVGCDQELVVRDDAEDPAQQASSARREPRLDQEVRQVVRRDVVAE